jgi:hypothetical protein
LTASLAITFPFNIRHSNLFCHRSLVAFRFMKNTAHPMKLVTVMCEALAKESLLRVLEKAGAHGHTLFQVEGSGAQGLRTGEMSEFANIQVEVIVPPAVAVTLLDRLQQEFFPRFAMVAYEMDIRVLRPDKF